MEIGGLAPAQRHRCLPALMANRADGLQPIARKLAGVDDGEVLLPGGELASAAQLDVLRPGPVAAFAADGLFADRELVNRVVFLLDSTGVTGDAFDRDAAFEAPVLREVITGRHVPFFPPRVPGDRR